MEELEKFDRWWSAIDVKNYITPRDFMWYNETEKYMEWVFAIPDNYKDFGDYSLEDFPGGLYAVITSKDNEYAMNHVITPKVFKEKMGYHLSDNFIPIVVKY